MIKLIGADKLSKRLDKLSFAVETRITDKALKSAATPILKDAKRRVKFDFGDGFFERDGIVFNIEDIKKSLTKQIRRTRKATFIIIGPGKLGWFAHWLEFGTLAKRSRPLEQPRKRKAAPLVAKGMGLVKVPFLRPAFIGKSNEALRKLQITLKKEIERAN